LDGATANPPTAGARPRLPGALGLAAWTVGLLACGDPSQPDYWVGKLNNVRERREAVRQLGLMRSRCRLNMKTTSHCAQLADAAVPALLTLVEEDKRPEELQTLIQFHDKRALPLLVKLLDSDAAAVAGPAATELGELADPAAVEPLAKLVVKPVPRGTAAEVVKANAIKALGKLKDTRAVEPLVEVLETPPQEQNINLHRLAALALGRLGSAKAAGPLVRALFMTGKEGTAFQQARAALVELGPPAVPPLLTALEGKDAALAKLAVEREFDKYTPGVIAYKAAYVLGDLRARAAVEPLLEALNRPALGDVHRGVVYALGAIGDRRATAAVIGVLSDPKARWQDRVAAADGLELLGDPAALPALLRVLDSSAAPPRGKSTPAKRAKGRPAMEVAPTGGASDPGTLQVRVAAALAYSRLGDGSEVATFKPLAEHETDAREVFFQSLGRLQLAQRCAAKPECYRTALGDANWISVEKAALMLARLGDRGSLPALVAKLSVAEPVARFAVLRAVTRLSTKSSTETITRLQQILDQEGTQSTKQDFVYEARVALATIRHN
jgi:HEAT repeat protein